MSGTQVELRKTKDDVDALGEAFDNLGTITGNFARAAALAFGENAAAFKAIALAEAIIATARGVAQALPQPSPLAALRRRPRRGAGRPHPLDEHPRRRRWRLRRRVAAPRSPPASARRAAARGLQPINVNSNVLVSGEARIVAVDGFAVMQKLSATQATQRRALGQMSLTRLFHTVIQTGRLPVTVSLYRDCGARAPGARPRSQRPPARPSRSSRRAV